MERDHHLLAVLQELIVLFLDNVVSEVVYPELQTALLFMLLVHTEKDEVLKVVVPGGKALAAPG